jgi:phosphate starvation-inducible PhoH-like protein
MTNRVKKSHTPPPAKSSIVMFKEFKPKTKNQAEAVRDMIDNDITILIGPSGTGKTLCAIGLALTHLKEQKINKILIARPTIESSPKGIGFIPGTVNEKMTPYLVPLFELIKEYIGKDKLEYLLAHDIIEVAPIEYFRGRNISDKTYLIADECQNCTLEQLKMIMTRLCNGAKIFIIGDVEQCDLGYTKFSSGLQTCVSKLEGSVDGLAVSRLDISDIQRNKIIGQILEALED